MNYCSKNNSISSGCEDIPKETLNILLTKLLKMKKLQPKLKLFCAGNRTRTYTPCGTRS